MASSMGFSFCRLTRLGDCGRASPKSDPDWQLCGACWVVVNTAEYSVVVNTMEAVVCVAGLWVSHVVAMLWHSHAVAPNDMMTMKT